MPAVTWLNRRPTTCSLIRARRFPVDLYTQLSIMGFRRSGDHLYRPHCSRCNACVPSRVRVDGFSRSRSQNRVWNRNQDLRVVGANMNPLTATAYQLYHRYIEGRHADGDMYPRIGTGFRSFLNNGLQCTRYFRFYEGESLVGVVVADQMLDGLSAITPSMIPVLKNAAWEPTPSHVLYQIHLMQEAGLDYVCLGYWIQNSHKMNYKSRFRPLELLQNGSWQPREHLPPGVTSVTVCPSDLLIIPVSTLLAACGFR